MNFIGFKEAKCRNCYKCVRICDVKAITVKNEQASINNNQCILCGHCLNACPQNAKSVISDIHKVKSYLKSGIPTILSIAPAYLGILKFKKPGQVASAFMKLGFHQVRETAEGAAYVTREYCNLLEHGSMDNIITTCCPSVNDLIEIYYPELTNYMAPVISPMIAHGKLIKSQFGQDIKVVFLGPCISKKREALDDPRTSGYIDAVVNFTEVEQWLQEEGICIEEEEDIEFHNPSPSVNRLYPISSGIISSVVATKSKEESYRKFYVHGMANCIELFTSMKDNEIHGCFIEVNICNGGCIKGPAVDGLMESRFKVKLDMEETIEKIAVDSNQFYLPEYSINLYKPFHNRSPRSSKPSEGDILDILSKVGKLTLEDELNCGACGYGSCREKAIAVYQQKAELTMCIPYMRERATSMANVVLETTPNLILLVDRDYRIVEYSQASSRYFPILSKRTETYLYELIDPVDFEHVLESKESIYGKKVHYKEYNLVTLQNIVYIKEQDAVLGIFLDISKEEEANLQAYRVKMDTIEMAQAVINKQMMVAQQIAGLLGETTAETKVTLTKLRDTILQDGN